VASLAPVPGVVRVVVTSYNTRISPGGSDTAAQDRPSGRVTIVSSRSSLPTSRPATA